MLATASLKDLCELIVDCPHSTPVWTDTGPTVLRSQNIRNGRLSFAERSHTDEEHYQMRIRRAEPRPRDLVITREAPMGEVCMIPEGLRCCLGQRMVLLRPRQDRCDPHYLLYALQSATVRHEILVSEGTGSTVSNLRIPLLEKLPIPVRPLPHQRAIGRTLGTLDDKIELNRRMNQTLEAIAQALFKSWFIDPVQGGLPEGWQAGSLADVALIRAESVDPGTQPTRVWEHYSIPAFDEGKSPAADPGVAIKSNKYKVPSTAVLLSKLNPSTPRVWLPALLQPDAAVCSTEFVPFVPRVPKHRPFLFELLRSATIQEQVAGRASGTTGSRQRVSPADIASIPCAIPPATLIEKFSHITEPKHTRFAANIRESLTLAQLRDALLPKLLSGEIRIKDAERFTEAST